MKKARVGVVLSGCGVRDGSEIHEVVLTALALERAGAEVIFMAPNIPQARVVNHLTGEIAKENRNVLEESARIARGKIRPLDSVKSEELDALVMPGGSGAALNLTDFAEKGPRCSVDPDLERLLKAMKEAGKPMGFMCYGPLAAARVFGEGVELTMGESSSSEARGIEAMGARHIECPATEARVDTKNRIVSTPAYMRARSLIELEKGISALVDGLTALL